MRTTLDLDPTALDAARQIASHQDQSLGRVVSELIFEGLRARAALSKSLVRANGFPVVPRQKGQKPVTDDDVRRLLDESA
ncbi:MAG TPA: antitoxin [Casimicrobiaceae bacterium]|nr:antitoxin [Casimicrobiaceae bacterium]